MHLFYSELMLCFAAFSLINLFSHQLSFQLLFNHCNKRKRIHLMLYVFIVKCRSFSAVKFHWSKLLKASKCDASRSLETVCKQPNMFDGPSFNLGGRSKSMKIFFQHFLIKSSINAPRLENIKLKG